MSKLALACELSFNEWLETFPEVIPEAERSKKHEKWKKKLFDKMRNDRYHTFTTKTIKVMLVAAIISALLLTAFVIPSSREFILDRFDIASRYKITENNKNSVTGEITVGYIPDGFEFDESINMGKNKSYRYININEEFFTIFKYSSSMEIDFNTEDSVSEEIIVDDIEYVFCKGNYGKNNLIWNRNDYVYQIESSLNKEELLKIAKTVE